MKKRKTAETEVLVELNSEKTEISTSIPFFDHLLSTLAKFMGKNFVVRAKGDLEHHIIEDVAICLGETLAEIEKKGIRRFGFSIIPMDDAVAICGLDFSGRGYLVVEGDFGDGEMKSYDFLHFLDTFCRRGGINVYLKISGVNPHHKMEATMKAIGIALKGALEKVGDDYLSTKGVL